MALKSELVDGRGGSQKACVTSRGELVVGRSDYSLAYNVTADVINTGYNLVEPKAGKRFVITDIFLYANKNVGAGDATVVLYEADADNTATVSKTLFTSEMLKQTRADLTGLNLIVTAGKWVNVKTDDDDIFCTIMGYYVDA
jgi:hypothetical protein